MNRINRINKNIDNLLSNLVIIPQKDSFNNISENEVHSRIDLNIYLKIFIHELRTPLSTISMGLNLLETSNPNTKNNKNKQIVHDLKESIVFIENIFSKFATIQEGNIQLNEFKPFSINYIFKRVEFILKYYLKENDSSINYIISPTLNVYDWNYGDRYNIKHCIINLLKNAVKYRNINSSKTISIAITTNTNANHIIPQRPSAMLPSNRLHILHSERNINASKKFQNICISITDYNPHILPKVKERLFESFNSTSGSGLGLYICKNIIELHGGTITHEFIHPVGNKFTIFLSLELCEDPVLQISPNIYEFIELNNDYIITYSNTVTPDDTPNVSSKNDISPWKEISMKVNDKLKPSLMLIDDSILNCKMMYKTFKKMDIFSNIYICLDGNDAIRDIEKNMNKIDIIFLDKNMPNIDGFEVANKLQQLKYDKLIFGITGEDDPIEIQRFINNGVDYVLIKPINIDKINLIYDFITQNGKKRHHDQTIQIVDGVLRWMSSKCDDTISDSNQTDNVLGGDASGNKQFNQIPRDY